MKTQQQLTIKKDVWSLHTACYGQRTSAFLSNATWVNYYLTPCGFYIYFLDVTWGMSRLPLTTGRGEGRSILCVCCEGSASSPVMALCDPRPDTAATTSVPARPPCHTLLPLMHLITALSFARHCLRKVWSLIVKPSCNVDQKSHSE